MSNDKNTIYTKVAFISLSVLQRYNLIFNLQNFQRFFFEKFLSLKFRTLIPFRHCKDKDFILIYKKIREKFFVKNEFYYFKNNFQKIFAYLKNFIICVYIIYYQKFLSNFHSLTSGRPKLPARCPLYNTCMITD